MTRKSRNCKPPITAELTFAPRKGGYVKGHETREAILRAAHTILINEGYKAMSMRRVAAECGVEMGHLTYHFPSGEDLLRELLDAVIRTYEIEFDSIFHMPDTTPEERLAKICKLILDDIRTKATTKIFPELWALSNHDPFVSDRVQEAYERERKPIYRIIEEMRPDLDGKSRKALAVFISAAMEGTTIFAGFEKPFEPIMKTIQAISIKAFIQVIKLISQDELDNFDQAGASIASKKGLGGRASSLTPTITERPSATANAFTTGQPGVPE